MRKTCLVLVLFLIAAISADVLAGKPPIEVDGYWGGYVKSKATLKRVGKAKDPNGYVAAAVDGTTWLALDEEDVEYSGTLTRKKNKLFLDFDLDGMAGLEESIGLWIDSVADDEGAVIEDLVIDITSVVCTAKAKNHKKKGRSLKYKLKVKFLANADVDGEYFATKGTLQTIGKLAFDGDL